MMEDLIKALEAYLSDNYYSKAEVDKKLSAIVLAAGGEPTTAEEAWALLKLTPKGVQEDISWAPGYEVEGLGGGWVDIRDKKTSKSYTIKQFHTLDNVIDQYQFRWLKAALDKAFA